MIVVARLGIHGPETKLGSRDNILVRLRILESGGLMEESKCLLVDEMAGPSSGECRAFMCVVKTEPG